MERSHQIVESLLAKPGKKPQIGPVVQSSVLQKAALFMPEFIKTTDKIISDPSTADLGIKIKQVDENEHTCQEEEKEQDRTQIEMELGLGVYDVHGQVPEDRDYYESTQPIVKVHGFEGEVEQESESESDSDQDQVGHSDTTCQTKKPLIEEITTSHLGKRKHDE